MNFKKLYFGLLGLLGGLLLGVFLASPSLDHEVFTSKQLQSELTVAVGNERLPSDKAVISHSPRVNRIIHLPYLVAGLTVIGLVLGFIATAKERKQPSKSVPTTAMTPPPAATAPAPLSDL